MCLFMRDRKARKNIEPRRAQRTLAGILAGTGFKFAQSENNSGESMAKAQPQDEAESVSDVLKMSEELSDVYIPAESTSAAAEFAESTSP